MNLIVTSLGRPLGRVPLLKWRDGANWLLVLRRVDVSDVRNSVTPFYEALVETHTGGGMTTLALKFPRRTLVIIITKRISFHVTPNQTD